MSEEMPASVLARIRSDRASWPGVAARADRPEADAAHGIAADPSVLDTERDPFYSRGVTGHQGSVDGLSGGRKDATPSHRVSPSRTTTAAEAALEAFVRANRDKMPRSNLRP